MTQETDSTGINEFSIGATDATVTLSWGVDPIVDLWFRHRGRASRRRFMNMARMRFKKYWSQEKLESIKLTDQFVKEYVNYVLQPGYRLSWKE